MDVKLVFFRPDGTTKEIQVKPGRYVIGRKPDAGLRIPLPSISRDHCELVHDGATLSVRDLGSSNGTFKNQERVKQAALTAGDRLGVGPFVLTVQIDGKPSSIAPPGRDADDDEDEMMDTPPQAMQKRPAPSSSSPDDSGMQETLPRNPPVGAAKGGGKASTDDSSIFEFDFDFEDEDHPKL